MSRRVVYGKVRKICMALPGAEEKPFGGHTVPAFRVRDKIFVNTGQVGRDRITFKAAPGEQQALTEADPDRFFVPDYVGSKGWVGAWLDAEQDWDELAELIEESYRLIAPKGLVAELDRLRSRPRRAVRDGRVPRGRATPRSVDAEGSVTRTPPLR